MKIGKMKVLTSMFLLTIITLIGCDAGEKVDIEGSGGGNGDATVLKLASDAPQEHIATELNNDLAEMVKEKTEGRVEVEYFPASQLGGYETVYEEIMRGSIDAGQITIPDALDAKFGAAYMPYYAKSFEEAGTLLAPDAYLSEEIGKLTAENDVRFLGFVLEGFIGQGYTKEPKDIFTPEGNKGVKTRSPGISTFSVPLEALGFTPLTVPYDEVPTAIQTKVVDGWVGGTPNMNYAWVGEVIDYMYVNYMYPEATTYVMSEKTIENLSEEDAEIVIDIFQEQSEKSFSLAEENENTYKEKLKEDHGVEVIEFTEEQVDVYAEFVRENVWPKLEGELSKELVDGMRDEIEKLE